METVIDEEGNVRSAHRLKDLRAEARRRRNIRDVVAGDPEQRAFPVDGRSWIESHISVHDDMGAGEEVREVQSLSRRNRHRMDVDRRTFLGPTIGEQIDTKSWWAKGKRRGWGGGGEGKREEDVWRWTHASTSPSDRMEASHRFERLSARARGAETRMRRVVKLSMVRNEGEGQGGSGRGWWTLDLRPVSLVFSEHAASTA
jgi:hypothetical protein